MVSELKLNQVLLFHLKLKKLGFRYQVKCSMISTHAGTIEKYYLYDLNYHNNNAILKALNIIDIFKFASNCYGHKIDCNKTHTESEWIELGYFPSANSLESLKVLVNKIYELIETL